MNACLCQYIYRQTDTEMQTGLYAVWFIQVHTGLYTVWSAHTQAFPRLPSERT